MFSRKIYADNSATTKVRPEVVSVMVDTLQENFGNPSSLHSYGKNAKKILNESRKNIASLINADEDEIVFTSGGTESNNLVIFGLTKMFPDKKHLVTTKIEHSSVKEPFESLEKNGWEITWLDVDKKGFIDIEQLKSSLKKDTLLVSIIHSNNEIGTIQDIETISSICKEKKVLLHSDCIQSFGKISIDVKELNVDFISLSGHKIYGPKGIGALYIKSSEHISPLLIGGGQENSLRPGTENLPGIAGFGMAAKLLKDEMDINSKKLKLLQSNLMEKIIKIDGVILTGPDIDELNQRLPGHVSICTKDIEGESLVLQMDLKGIAVSSGSACSSQKKDKAVEPSHVIKALRLSKDYEKGSLRISFGIENTAEDVECIESSLKEILEKVKRKVSC